MGVSVITESALLGITWHYFRRKHSWAAHPVCLLGFGILVHILMLALTSTLPKDDVARIFKQIAIPVITIYPIATVLVCMLFLDQEARVRADKALRESESDTACSSSEQRRHRPGGEGHGALSGRKQSGGGSPRAIMLPTPGAGHSRRRSRRRDERLKQGRFGGTRRAN